MAKKDGKRVSDLVNSALKAYIDGDVAPVKLGEPIHEVGATQSVGSFVLSVEDEGEVTLSKNDVLDISRDMGPFKIKLICKLQHR